MANFKTHIFVASVVSGITSVIVSATGLANISQALTYFVIGLTGGLLPDIDADNSAPVRLLFNGLALGLAFVTVFYLLDRLSIVELILAWGGSYVAIRYLAFGLFTRFTVHRGVFHSILAALFFAGLTASVASHGFGSEAQIAWLSGSFLFMGYLVHLILDEVYSVDLLNRRVKKSFGSALKIVSLKRVWPSLALGVATYAVLMTTPNFAAFLDTTFDHRFHENFSARLLPGRQ